MTPRLLLALLAGLVGFQAGAVAQPYGGSPLALPGVIEAERYDFGGSGVAYSDTTTGNSGAVFRADDVDIVADSTAGGGHKLTQQAVGEWLRYTVATNLSTSRPFANITFRYQANYRKSVRLRQGTTEVATLLLPAATGTNWGEVRVEKAQLAVSTSTPLRLDVLESGDNALFGNKTTVGPAEQWDVIDAGSTAGTTDSIMLRSVLTGRYLRLTSKDKPIYADGVAGTTVQERFILGSPASGLVSLRSRNVYPHDTYISINSSTAAASAKAMGDGSSAQRFTVVDLGAAPGVAAGVAPIGRRVALRNANTNAFISIANDPGLMVDSIKVEQWINKLPVIDMIFDRTITRPATSLTVSAVAQELDPSGSIVSRTWTQLSGPSIATIGTNTVALNTPEKGKERTTVTISGLQTGFYRFRFSAGDDMGDASSRDFEVAVLDTAQFTEVPATDSRIQFFGRVHNVGSTAPRIGWSNAGVRVRFNGTALAARLETGSFPGGNKQKFYAIINGDDSNPRIIDTLNSTGVMHIVTGLPAGNHSLTLYSLSGGNASTTTFGGLLLGPGTTLLAPPARPQRRIEFYGDSITEGGLMPDYPFPNTYRAYAGQAARLLGAEAHIIAKSGLGLVFDHYAGGSFGQGTLEGQWNRATPHDDTAVWDFTRFDPHVVVVNIMQNDKWIEEDNPTPNQVFVDAYVNFLRLLRAKRPTAQIVCALGSMDAVAPGSKWPGIMQQAVDTVRAADNDTRLHTLVFPFIGAYRHPNTAEATAMAAQLKAYLDGLPYDVWLGAPPVSQTYHLYSESGSEFTTDGGTIIATSVTATTQTTGAPEGSQFLRLVDTANYASYDFRFPGGEVNKATWGDATLIFDVRSGSTHTWEIGVRDATGTLKRFGLGSYIARNGQWETATVPMSHFTAAGVNLSRLNKIYFYHPWRSGQTLDVDDVIVLDPTP